jgi:hypothetical protein
LDIDDIKILGNKKAYLICEYLNVLV